MDESSLRAEFERAVATRPPTQHLVANALRAGKRLRRRRKVEAAAASVGAVAVVAVLASLASGQFRAADRHRTAATGSVRSEGVAYVLTQINAATSRVTPVRLRTGVALKPLAVRGVVMQLATAPGGKAVYVFSTPHNYVRDQQNYVTTVNAATGVARRPVKLSGGLQEIYTVAIAPSGRYAYASESGTWPGSQDGSSALVAINLTTGAEHALVDGAGSLAITPDGRMGYALRTGQDVIPVDLASGTVEAPCKVPGQARAVAIAPDGRTAYVLSDTRSSNLARPGSALVTPIDIASGTVGKSIRLPVGEGRFASGQLAIAANGKTAYLSAGPSIVRISLPSGKVLRPIRLQPILGGYTYNLVIAPHGTTGYAVPLMKWVQPLDLRSGTGENRVYLPSGYRTVTAPVLDLSGNAFYVGATAYSPSNVREDAIIPIQVSSQQPGQPIWLVGLPVQVVIAG